MIIYSKEPLNIMMKNILLLDDPFTSGYVYVSKETYDQALSLSLTFNQDISRVKGTISGKGMLNWAANKSVNLAVSLCSEKMPSPINMLAPYLAYTLPVGVEWSEDNEEIIKMGYGILHQMSQFINFYQTALMPAGTKAEVTMPKNILMAYEESWRAQLETLDKCVVVLPVYVGGQAPTSSLKDKVTSSENISQIEVSDIVGTNTEQQEAVSVPDFVSEDTDEINVQPRGTDDAAINNESEDTGNGEKEETAEVVAAPEENSETKESDEDGDEGEEDDMEAKILALMKSIEEAPAEDFQTKESESVENKSSEPASNDRKEETVNAGDSGSINMTEREIAEGNRKVLNDYDI